MTQYLLSVHTDFDGPMPSMEEMQPVFEAVDRFNNEIQAEGAWVFGGGLTAPSSATVVRAQEAGDPVVTDGPYTETKEALGGFWIVEAADLDAALALATRASVACAGPVEVRPFQDEPAA